MIGNGNGKTARVDADSRRDGRLSAGRGLAFGMLAILLTACGGAPPQEAPPQYSGSADDPWGGHIREASERFDVPELWIRAVMHVESRGRTHMNGRPTTSHAGAMGLMQVMPATYRELAGKYGLGPDAHNPRDNILAGTAYIREMYEIYGSPGFLAAYNAGPGRYGWVLEGRQGMPAETRNYMNMIGPVVVQAEPRVRVAGRIERDGSPMRPEMLQLAERTPASDFMPSQRVQIVSAEERAAQEREIEMARVRAEARIAANTRAVEQARADALARQQVTVAAGLPPAPSPATAAPATAAPATAAPSAPTALPSATAPRTTPVARPGSGSLGTLSVTPAAATAATGATGGWGIQVGAFGSIDQVNAALDAAQASAPEYLSAARRTTMEVTTEVGRLYRARLSGLDAQQALRACQTLTRAGQDCVQVSPTG